MARIGLVLGAGGVTGGAFHAGVLAGLEEATGWDPRTAELIVGTSAGSVTAATLRAGLSAPDLAARSMGHPLSPAGVALLTAAGAPLGAPPTTGRPSGRHRGAPAAPEVLLAGARRPWGIRPMAMMAGLMPEGAVPTAPISSAITALLGDRWPSDRGAGPGRQLRRLWVAAVRLEDGQLVVFGRGGSPPAGTGEAVAASCAIPGWFTPVTIGGVRYVDGGVHSLTNLSQVAAEGFDVVIVSAPMGRAGRTGYHGPLRQAARAQLALEAHAVRRHGALVVAFQPTAEDQAVMGPNAMDPRTRPSVVRQTKASTLTRLAQPELRRLKEHLG